MPYPWSHSRSRARVIFFVFMQVALLAGKLSAQSLPAPWTLSDVGFPTVAGSATYSSGVFNITAAGTDIGGVQDQFSLVQQRLTGDVTIIARVPAPKGDRASKAGVMIRESLDPASRNLFAMVMGSGTVSFQRRRATGGNSIRTNSSTASTVWLKIERHGSTFVASRSSDGATWAEIGSEIIAMPGTVYVGLALTSARDLSSTTVAFTNVSATATSALPPPPATPPGWSGIDIGLPSKAGSESESAGVYTVSGGGAGMAGSADQFHFMYRQITGDADIVGRVKAVQYINDTTTGGLMVRDSLTTNGAHGSIAMRAGGGTAFQQRSAAGGLSSTSVSGTMNTPYWVKLQVRAGVVTAFRSATGSTWTQVGSVTLALPSTFYVGVAATSTDTSASASAILDNLTVTAFGPQNQPPTVSLTSPDPAATYTAPAQVTISANAADTDGTITQVDFFQGSTLLGSASAAPYSFTWNNVPAGTYSFTAVAHDNSGATTTSGSQTITVSAPPSPPPSQGLPSGWSSVDIGGPTATGSSQYSSGTFTVKGAGILWNYSDMFRYAYQPFTGDITITSRVASIENTSAWAKAGVMIRETLSADSKNTSLVVTPGNGAVFFYRDTTGQPPQGPFSVGTGAPAWLRLERRGTLVTAYYSTDGVTWTAVGTAPMTTATMYVGLAVSSEDSTRTAAGVFDNVTVSAPTANQPPTVSLTAPANGATYTAPASITLSASASDSDGTIVKIDFYANGVLLGSDSSAPYSYTWGNVAAGNYTFAAVAADNSNATTTSATRTVTVNPAANQAPTVSLTAPANGATYTAPATVSMSATASDTDGTISRVDFYNGSTLIGSATASPYNFTWSSVAAGSYSLTAVARDNAGATTTSAARSITVTASTALPTGWSSGDIGGPTAAGSAQYSSGTFTVKGAGILWNYSDMFRYAYQSFTGDITITSRVVSIENTSPWAKAGVMIRETLSADSKNTSLVVTPGNGAIFFHRDTTAQPPQGPFTAGSGAPAWVRLERRGTIVTGFYSTDGVSWTSVGTSMMTTATMYVGLAVSSEDSTRTAAGVFDNVTLTAPTPNQAPTVSLSAPASGATFTAPATVTVTATASDTDGTVSSVSFYAGATLIGTDTSSPYSVTWNNAAAGNYTLTAVATDNAGATTTSAGRSITVNPSANQAPTVSLTAPANGATYTAPASVTITANASDTDGTIAQVDFYAGSTLIGSDTSSPYSFTWSNVATGSYSLTAVARDNAGATTTSAARSITVSGSTGTSTHAVFNPSPDHNTLVVRYQLDIFTSGSNPNTATPVATKDLGKPAVVNGECDVDITQTVNALAAGSYIATVSAVGSSGSGRSAAASFTK